MNKTKIVIVFTLLTLIPLALIVGYTSYSKINFSFKKKAADQLSPTGAGGDFQADKIFGQSGFTENSPNQVVNNRVFHPQGFAIDKNTTPNKIYIWDSGNHRILGLTAGRNEADLVFGQPDFNHASCNGSNITDLPNASTSTLCSQVFGQISLMESPQPNSMAVDNNHNLYAFDPYNNRVLKYNDPYSSDKSQGKGDTIADFVWGQPNFESRQPNQGGSPNNKTLDGDYGVGVDVDNQGNVWVADVGNKRVLRFPPNSKEADLVLGQQDFTSVNGLACNQCYKDGQDTDPTRISLCQSVPPPTNSFCFPRTAKVSPHTGEVFIIDWSEGDSTYYFRVLVYRPPFVNGMPASEVILGSGHERYPGFSLYRPASLEIDFQQPDAFWITAGYNRVLYFQKINTVWQITKRLTDSIESPGGVALDSEGNVYTDTLHGGQEVKKFKAPIPTTCPTCPSYPFESRILKSQDSAFSSPNKVSGAGLWDPGASLTIDYLPNSSGINKQLFVADRSRILVWNNYDQKPVGGSSADFVLLEPDFETLSGRGGARSFDKDSLGRFWLVKDNGIFVFQGPITRNLMEQDANFTIPLSIPLRSGGNINFGNNIVGLAYDEKNDALWISDNSNFRLVRIANPLNQTQRKIDMIIGQPNLEPHPDSSFQWANRGVDDPYYNDPEHDNIRCPHLSADGFGNITMIKFDNFGNLYVVDGSREGWQCSNNRLLEFDKEALIPHPTKDFFSDSDPDRESHKPKKVYGGSGFEGTEEKNRYRNGDNNPFTPVSVGFDSQNKMVVTADGYGNPFGKRVFVYNNPLSNCNNALRCRVEASTTIPISGAQLSSPSFDQNGNLTILDHTWNRVLYFENPYGISIQVSATKPVSALISTPTPTSTITHTPTPTPTVLPTEATLIFTIKLPGISRDNTPSKTVYLFTRQSGQPTTSIIGDAVVSNLNNGTGKYQGIIRNISPGVYDIYLKTENCLRKLMQANVNLLPGTNRYDWSTVPLIAGDTNNDNKITFNDITGIISVWNQSSTPATSENQQYDLNLDGIISLNDITAVIGNWTASEARGD